MITGEEGGTSTLLPGTVMLEGTIGFEGGITGGEDGGITGGVVGGTLVLDGGIVLEGGGIISEDGAGFGLEDGTTILERVGTLGGR